MTNYIDDFFNSIPKVEMTEDGYKLRQQKDLEEDAKYYSKCNEKGYLI